jgi:hypothetical protein
MDRVCFFGNVTSYEELGSAQPDWTDRNELYLYGKNEIKRKIMNIKI